MRKVELNGGYVLYVSSRVKETVEEVKASFEASPLLAEGAGVICPKYLDNDGKIFYCGGGFTKNSLLPYGDAMGEDNVGQYPNPREVEFSPFWAFAIKDSLGFAPMIVDDFDLNIYDHADFAVKLAKVGVKISVDPSVVVTCDKSPSDKKEEKKLILDIENSQKKFIAEHGGFLRKRWKLPVMWHSHTGFPGGYCCHSRELLHALFLKGVDLHYKFIGGTNDDEPPSENFVVDDLREDMGSMRMPQVTLSTGKNCFSNSGDRKIGFTTTEVNGIPRDWVKVLNEMDEVWTTSEFAKKGFEDSGVKPPIFNMREGINPEYFHPGILPFEHKYKDHFVFISNFAWGRRKGIAELFEAFSREFSEGEKVVMILKVLPSYHNANIQDDMKKLFSRKGEAEIVVWEAVIPPYMLPSFYCAGDCLVFPTRGEGFGLPPLEALSCGVPVITTGYSAQTEYLMKDGKKLPGVEFIDHKMGEFDGSDSIYYKGFQWALPDVKHLQKLMRKVFDNREKYKADALESSKHIRQEWSWARAADLVIERLKHFQK